MRSSLPIALSVSLILTACQESVPPFTEAEALQKQVSGQNAFQHVSALVDFGPRPPESEALEKSRVYIEEQLSELGWIVRRQTFEKKTPLDIKEFTNLRARFGERAWDTKVEGLLCSHYDTKLYTDFEFVGANDAGSSTGLLIELARVLALKPAIAQRIELVFFDGEEAFGTNITARDGLYGSRYYASEMVLIDESKRPQWGLLLDMVGDADLNIRAGVRVPNPPIQKMKDGEPIATIDYAAVAEERNRISRLLIDSANDLDLRKYVGISPDYITDDHVPLNISAGIPTIDLIDFDYDYWHTPGDTLDKITAESLEITGRVTLQLVEKYLLNR